MTLFCVTRFFAALDLLLRVSDLVTADDDLFTLLSLVSGGALAFTAADLSSGSFA